MKFLRTAFIMTFLVISLAGCKYDIVVPELLDIDPGTPEVSFTKEIIPLFAASCINSGCHHPGAVKPDLTLPNAYSELFTGSYIDTIQPAQSDLYLWLTGKRSLPMPLTGPDNEINAAVLTWITQGAKNN